MIVRILKETGFDEAILGLSLSHGVTIERAQVVAMKLSQQDGGHNKFLEEIMVWLDVTAPRHWWQEADTYRIATKQSESTMHTLHKRELTVDDFDRFLPPVIIDYVNSCIFKYNRLRTQVNPKADPQELEDAFMDIKNALPEGFLQRRIWMMSYKTVRNMVRQRVDHRQPGWRKELVPFLKENVCHPWFL